MHFCKKERLFFLYVATLGFIVALTPRDASALVMWTFDNTGCVSTLGPSGNCGAGDTNYSDLRVYQTSSGVGGDVAVSGWANTITGNTQLELGQITHFGGGGLGVRNADGPRGQDIGEGTSPEDGVDNDERFDMVLFDFGHQLVDLSQITLGSWQQDADISVLAYIGNLDPTDDTGADYIGDREAWWNSDLIKDEDLTSHGWSLIGNHDVDNTDPTNPAQFSPATADINSGGTASSYWLISAYNPVFGGSCTPANSYCQSDYEDYFQIQALAGDVRGEFSQVPEPTTLLLMGIGLVGLGFARRRRLNA
ncbi:PEP-CTERM sorting domain-containing protein [Gammaproteobacteria bacterium]|nr:PEP-CTERM sorting domain-containing protein [Gammaproteobacteria bacterium]